MTDATTGKQEAYGLQATLPTPRTWPTAKQMNDLLAESGRWKKAQHALSRKPSPRRRAMLQRSQARYLRRWSETMEWYREYIEGMARRVHPITPEQTDNP